MQINSNNPYKTSVSQPKERISSFPKYKREYDTFERSSNYVSFGASEIEHFDANSFKEEIKTAIKNNTTLPAFDTEDKKQVLRAILSSETDFDKNFKGGGGKQLITLKQLWNTC